MSNRTHDSHEEQMADEINNSPLGGKCLYVLIAIIGFTVAMIVGTTGQWYA